MLPFHDLAAEPLEIFTNTTIHTLGLGQELYMIVEATEVTVILYKLCYQCKYLLFPTTHTTTILVVATESRQPYNASCV